MTRKSQKDLELFYAEQFANIMNYKWNIIVPEDEQNYPDLLIDTHNSMFGLEVRELFVDEGFENGSKLKNKEQTNINVLQELASKYYENSKKPIYVKIFGKVDSNNFDKVLMVLLNSKVNQNQVVSEKLITNFGLLTVNITGLTEEFSNYSYWQNISDNIGIIKSSNLDYVEEVIKLKSKKIPKYSHYIKNVSLLLFCTPLFNSGKLHFEKWDSIQKFGFINIYIYKHPQNGYQY